jgi:hypothetical protein
VTSVEGRRRQALQLEELTLRPGSLTGWKRGRQDAASTLQDRWSEGSPSSEAGAVVLLFAAISDTKDSMTTISLKIDEKLAASLDAEASARRTTRSALCRQALTALLRKSTKSKPSLLQQSKDLCGAGSSGLRDLSSNPRHLAGFGGKAR